LASAFCILSIRPDWIYDAGFQLSFLSVLAISMTALPLMSEFVLPLWKPLRHAGDDEHLILTQGALYCIGRRLRCRCELFAEAVTDRWSAWGGRLIIHAGRIFAWAGTAVLSMILVSVSVQLWLEPVLAYHFNRLSWIAPFANLLAVPLSSAVLGAGIVMVITPDAVWLVNATVWLASLLLKAAAWISACPFAWQRCPTPSLGWVIAGCMLLAFWYFLHWRHSWIPWLYVGSLLACLSFNIHLLCLWQLWLEPNHLHADQRLLRLTFLDVGEGDSMVLEFPDQRVWLIDAGGLHARQNASGGFDVGEAIVSRYLWHFWLTRLDRVVLTHSDADHAGGIPAVLKNFPVSRLEIGNVDQDLDQIYSVCSSKSIPVHSLHRGDAAVSGDIFLQVLNPPAASSDRSTNDGSIVLRLKYGRFSALLTGDLESAGEMNILAERLNMRSLLLKVSHHGSRHGTTELFLENVNPRWAVVSVGRNSFGHPAAEVMGRLAQQGVRTFLTQDQGAISFETDGIRYFIRSFSSGILESGILPLSAADDYR
jgi:competence protein ComEC